MAATTKEFILTQEGLEDLQKEYRRLIDEERPQVIEALQNARAMGDLSENADYDAARTKQAEVEARIKEIEAILANAKVVSESKKKNDVRISSTVKFRDVALNKEFTVKIVSSIEADPLSDPNNMRISNECALGQALIGSRVGEKVTVNAVHPYEVEILEII